VFGDVPLERLLRVVHDPSRSRYEFTQVFIIGFPERADHPSHLLDNDLMLGFGYSAKPEQTGLLIASWCG